MSKSYHEIRKAEVQRLKDIFDKRKGCKEAAAECQKRLTTLELIKDLKK